MFGNNPILKQVNDRDGMLSHVDTFLTIQGEGPHAGRPAVFIRLAGCNLQCSFCDTDFSERSREHSRVIARRAIELNCHVPRNRLYVITGGEPFRQNLLELVTMLRNDGSVQIETAGTLWNPMYDDSLIEVCTIVVSPKTGSVHRSIRARASAWKYIINANDGVDPVDGLPITNPQTGKPQRLARPPADATVFIQPMDNKDEHRNALNVACCVGIALKLGYRISLQQHKILGVA